MPDIKIEQNKSIEEKKPKPEAVESLDIEKKEAVKQEQAIETGVELKKRVQEQLQEATIPVMPPQPVADQTQAGSPVNKKKIEQILANDLEEIYLALPENKKEEFKKTGEKTAQEIDSLLSQAKVKVEKIISLIKNWLKLIPGVNKFFLEQEVKIKTDKIIKLRE